MGLEGEGRGGAAGGRGVLPVGLRGSSVGGRTAGRGGSISVLVESVVLTSGGGAGAGFSAGVSGGAGGEGA